MIEIEKIQAVLWDMDGVLVDTGDFHLLTWQKTFGELEIPFSNEQFRDTFGMNNAGILESVTGEKQDPDFVKEISERKEGLFRDSIRGKAELLPGVAICLDQFSNLRLKQAIVSSAPPKNIDFLVNELGIRKYFDRIVSGFDLPGKPNPDVFLKAARELDVTNTACLVIEDAVAGVKGAKRAGMKCIAVTTTNPMEALSQADIIMDSLENLRSHFRFN